MLNSKICASLHLPVLTKSERPSSKRDYFVVYVLTVIPSLKRDVHRKVDGEMSEDVLLNQSPVRSQKFSL
jgi:hypothetical protein